jgi:uncharacterized protein (DUF1800 family)
METTTRRTSLVTLPGAAAGAEVAARFDPGADALEPFRPGADGAWDRAAAAHLVRRAGFGMPPAEVERVLELGPARAVESYIAVEADDAETLRLLDTAMTLNNLETAQSWWIHQLLFGKHALREKVGLFWHGHFATSNQKVENPRLMLDQVNLFRRHGLGEFGELAQRVSKDPAMLIWLDSNSNRAGRPNENFARELMELFTLGIGNYTEDDIRESARAFTGWHVRGISFFFNERAHDRGPKRVLGKHDVSTGEEVVRLCFESRASARFVAGKLCRYFVHPEPSDAFLESAARAYEDCGRHVGRFLDRVLRSRAFFSREARRAIIASPADFALGTARTLGLRAAPSKMARHLRDMGQDLLQPPNVKGWDGGRAWISSTTLLARLRFTLDLVDERPALGAAVDWSALTGGEPLERLLDRFYPEGLSGDLRSQIETAAGKDDPRRLLAAALQLPEFQML